MNDNQFPNVSMNQPQPVQPQSMQQPVPEQVVVTPTVQTIPVQQEQVLVPIIEQQQVVQPQVPVAPVIPQPVQTPVAPEPIVTPIPIVNTQPQPTEQHVVDQAVVPPVQPTVVQPMEVPVQTPVAPVIPQPVVTQTVPVTPVPQSVLEQPQVPVISEPVVPEPVQPTVVPTIEPQPVEPQIANTVVEQATLEKPMETPEIQQNEEKKVLLTSVEPPKIDDKPVPKKDSGNLVVILLTIVIVLIIILGIVYYVLQKGKTEQIITQAPVQNAVLKLDSKSIMNKIDKKEIKTVNEYGKDIIAVELTNKVDRVVTISAQINYYNKNNELVDSKSDNINYFDTTQKAFLIFKTDYEYDHYKITYTAKDEKEAFPKGNDISKLELKNIQNKDDILVEIKNDSKETVSGATIITLFYKDNEIVALGDGYAFTIEKDSSFTVKIPLPKIDYLKQIEFDKYETYITEVDYE